MELISRKAVHDGMMKYGFISPDMTVHEFVEDELPSVPAVPLDKLCEWLEGAEKEGLCCLDCADLLRSKSFVTKWMERLDAAESMEQKT